jgi:hypothetical protein
MSVFRLFTASDYPFDSFKLFSNWFFFVVKTPGISVVFVLPNMYVLGVMSCGSLFVFVATQHYTENIKIEQNEPNRNTGDSDLCSA